MVEVRYENLEPWLERFSTEMVHAHLCEEYQKSLEAREQYLNLLSDCGWTEEQFDCEMLRRIDSRWDMIFFLAAVPFSLFGKPIAAEC